MNNAAKRWIAILVAAAVLIAVAAYAAFHFAVQALKGKVEEALGPAGEVAAIRVADGGVEIIGLRIRGDGAQGAWPAEDQLRAERIVVVPDLRSLLSSRVRIRAITVEGGYLSLLRTPAGRLRLLPSLLERPKTDGAPGPAIEIGRVELRDSALEFFDASVRKPPLKLRLEQLNASLDRLSLPDLAGKSKLDLVGVLKGARRDGKVSLKGDIELASKDSVLTTQLRGVDLVTLQPYLVKATETGVRRGTLDMDLKSTVQRHRLRAPGSLTLTGLELASGSTFMGMPRNAVVSMLKNRNDQIKVNFTLEGNLDDPKFALNENFATRVGASMAEGLGVSLEGLAKGVGSASSSAVKGVGEAVGKLFGK
ncbi:MAG: DUF748 domain-containing protein [Sulfuricellaceae bacterium]|jgi:hypothetical protein